MTSIVIFVPEVEPDSRIMKKEHLYGKYDKVVLVDNDLSNSFYLLLLKQEVYKIRWKPINKIYRRLHGNTEFDVTKS